MGPPPAAKRAGIIDAEDLHAIEPLRVPDQDPSALGEDGVVGGVPRHPEAFCDAGDGEVLADDALQRPAQAAAGDPGSGLGGLAGVLAPHVAAVGAPVAADRDLQGRGPPAQRLVRQPPDDAVAGCAFAAAASAPGGTSRLRGMVGFGDPAGEDRAVRLEALTDAVKAELVKAAERGQVGGSEGSVRHVEVFQMGCVGTPILGRPRPLPAHRRAERLYTLICDEPLVDLPTRRR